MKSNWIPTNDYYHRLLAETDAAQREQLYQELIIAPWQPMMSMMQQPGMAQDDPYAGAKAWGWLLPHQTDLMADLLQQMEAANAWETGRDAAAKAAVDGRAADQHGEFQTAPLEFIDNERHLLGG